MNEEDQLPLADPVNSVTTAAIVAPVTKRHQSQKTLAVLLSLLLVIVGAYAGYTYGISKNDTSLTTNGNSTVTRVTTPADDLASTDSTRSLLFQGNLFDTPDNYKTLAKLVIPSDLMAVNVSSNIGNPGPLGTYTDKFNDELARWYIGDPSNESDNQSGASEISIVTVSKSWLATVSQADHTMDTGGNPLQTTADKQRYVADLKSNSAKCAKDTKKGFVTKDEALSVCYKMLYGKDGYSPYLTLSGYGTLAGIPVLLHGGISIHDTTIFKGDSWRDAIAAGNAGKPTAVVQKKLNYFLSALPQTELSASTNGDSAR